jgi:3-oxoacyl-[acyl-carrier-protein] synthase II
LDFIPHFSSIPTADFSLVNFYIKSQISNLKLVKVVVTGIGLVSALGKNLEDSWQNLLLAKTGIKLHQLFPELGVIPLGLIAEKPTALNTITETVVTSALQDAQLVAPLPDCAVVIGSSRGYQASWEMMAQNIHQQAGGANLDNWLNTFPQMNAIAAVSDTISKSQRSAKAGTRVLKDEVTDNAFLSLISATPIDLSDRL